MEIKVGVVSDRGLNPKRPVNQDSYLVMPAQCVFAVFDGVGGQRAGEIASHLAGETVEEYFTRDSDESPRELMERAIRFANRDIYEMAEGDANYKTMATTAALLHLKGKEATMAHVGDSRIYRLEDGYFYRETIDHTDYNDDVRAGITPRQQGSNVINRALGAEPDVDIETRMIPLTDGTKFLLCSDGIYRHMSDEEIAVIVAQTKDPQAAADELQQIVMSRGADDNLTAIIIHVGRTKIDRVMGIVDALSAYLKPASAAKAESVRQVRRHSGALTKPAPAPSKGRFEVEFNPRTKRLEPLEAETVATANPTARVLTGDEEKPKSKFWFWLMIWILTIAGAFYGGLKLSDYWQQWSSKPNANDTPSQLKTAREAIERGDGAKAASELTKIIEREPQSAEARYLMGRAHLEQAKYKEALENFDEAVKLQSGMAEAWLYAAVAERALNNKAKADDKLEKYLEAKKPPAPAMQAPGNR